ncbi:MAG TPA: hypothetical protein VHS31_05705 [Tepidisphaeraceae bacterium]|jgi:hypothetical protein|nr:hypothetical protein [Tepidisphaeraceae bacterium]
MHLNRTSILTMTLGIAMGAAGFNLISGTTNPARAADDNRDERMKHDKWTTGDRARDALDHLKTAEEEMHHVADDDGSKVAKDASKMVSDARAKVDEFIGVLDAKAKH